jgi:hypothetical protein
MEKFHFLAGDCEDVAARFEQAYENPAIKATAAKIGFGEAQASLRMILALEAVRQNLLRQSTLYGND